MLTQEKIKSIFHYCPQSGIFTYKIRTNNRNYPVMIAGSPDKLGYLNVSFNYKKYKLHRVAWLYIYGEWPNTIDHINGIVNDNRIDNLRSCTQTINNQNQKVAQKRNKSTGILGVHICKCTGKFRASISINNKPKHLGRFKTIEEAHEAYIQAKRERHSGCTI